MELEISSSQALSTVDQSLTTNEAKEGKKVSLVMTYYAHGINPCNTRSQYDWFILCYYGYCLHSRSVWVLLWAISVCNEGSHLQCALVCCNGIRSFLQDHSCHHNMFFSLGTVSYNIQGKYFVPVGSNQPSYMLQ